MNTDPIADLITRIRNAQRAKHSSVQIPHSAMKQKIADLLAQEGFVSSVKTIEEKPYAKLEVELKYQANGSPVIYKIGRVSKPGCRVYYSKEDLDKTGDIFNTRILSTSSGVITDKKAQELGVGGEVICFVS